MMILHVVQCKDKVCSVKGKIKLIQAYKTSYCTTQTCFVALPLLRASVYLILVVYKRRKRHLSRTDLLGIGVTIFDTESSLSGKILF